MQQTVHNGAHNRWHARPRIPLAACRGRPAVARAGSSHRRGQATLAAFWPPNDAQRRRLLRINE
jgi:hypothetical protein